ncbi:family 16 glycosylhydrolase [uncultured Tateyamaria sp.]|uniref:family 16 glycosylhydrolase n=1 Tax=Tateyamaria sp. 1078 TaxID=3417464 RepID=UPI0026360EF5|nr:family 16 glycosylhydrolase [uncultured Tateyamaria sp.]
MNHRTTKAAAWLIALVTCAPVVSAQSSGIPDRDAMVPILNEEFANGLNRYDGRTGVWSTQSPRGGLMTNAQETVFLDPMLPDVPWSSVAPTLNVTPDGLSVRTVPLTDAQLGPIRAHMRATNQGKRAAQVRYATGRITTVETWSQVYGWFEIDAQIPRGKGRWPAFWLNFAGPGWPPEIDIFEAYGAGIAEPTPKDGRFNTAVLFDRLDEDKRPVHNVDVINDFDPDPERSKPKIKVRGGRNIYTLARHHFEDQLEADIYGRVNTFAAHWTPGEIVFYFGPDRNSLREIYRTPTPEDAHDPMYILANDQFTARGGIWPADADLDAVLDPENDLLIRAIRAWAMPPELTFDMAQGDNPYDDRRSIIRDTQGDDIIAPGAGFDIITLSGGADEIRLSRGREGTVVRGFGPDDRIVLEGFQFFDSADAHDRLTQVGDDVWLSSGSDPYWPQSIILRDQQVADIGKEQIVSRWPVGRNVWATRADVPNRSVSDEDADGLLTAGIAGGWLNDRARETRLVGGPGPERYLVSHPHTRIEEPASGDIDTLILWGRRGLPPHVERGILRGEFGRLLGTPGDDRLEAEGHGGQLSGGAGDDLFVIAEKASRITVRIDNAPGHDRLRGYNQSHDLLIAPTLRARGDDWVWQQVDEGILITFNADQSLLIEGADMAARGTGLQSP